MAIQVNAYPTREEAIAAQAYFRRHGAAVRPGEPILAQAVFLVAYTWESA